MFQRSKLNLAVSAAIAASVTVGPARAAEIEEVIVTATKRSQSAQDIAITVHALDEQTLKDLNIGNFEDYIRQLPGVVSSGVGPGRNEIYIRGISVGKSSVKVAAAGGSEPNVALYLDEAPISMGGRNMDAYLTDISRIEVLKGPQGTLFGASSQAGTVRLITNRPEFNEFSAGLDAGLSDISGGEISNSVEGFINIPLVDDTLAARVAVYNVKEGGYIDNLLGTKQMSVINPAITVPPVQADTAVNNNLAEDNFNDATFHGIRGSIKYQFNDDWDILLQHTHQELETEGVWDFDPTLGDLNVQTFRPDKAKDLFDHTAWTVNGRIAGLDVIYTGSYLDREVDATSDYIGYADTSLVLPYYICSYPGYATCESPDVFFDQFFGVERITHEFRFSTDVEKRWRLIAGVYYEDTETTERGDWNYPGSIEQGFAPNAPIAGATASNPNTRPPGVVFFNDFIRRKEEISLFGEVAFDIIEPVTLTFGARYYNLKLALNGSTNFGSRFVDTDAGRNVDEILAGQSPADFSDTIFRTSLQWRITDNAMVYGTRSEGYRAGGFNRNGGASRPQNALTGPFVPHFYESDELTNWEFGWKTTWFDGTLRFNGSVYFVEWNNIQVATIDHSISPVTFIDNTADAEIKGFELDTVLAATDNITLFGGLSFNDTEVTAVPLTVLNISPVGSPLANAPELQYTLRGRYDWDFGHNSSAFAQVAFQYTDDTVSSLVLNAQFPQDSYSTSDASFGYARDSWSVSFFIENIGDERADLFINDVDNIIKITPNRPRTFGLRISYRYEGL